MKKFFLFIAMCVLALVHTSCVTTVSLRILVPEDLIASDQQYMKKHYSTDYRWYESSAVLFNYLDSENCGGTIVELTNIFMIRSDKDSYDTNIIMFKHTLEGDEIQILPSHWVEEDVFIIPEKVRTTFKKATLQAKNASPKLHTKHVVLRKQLGPRDTNPQYIFGNNHGLVFVDASSGYMRYDSPAFENTGFITWLGEWPQ